MFWAQLMGITRIRHVDPLWVLSFLREIFVHRNDLFAVIWVSRAGWDLRGRLNTALHLFWFGENCLDETDTFLHTLAWAFNATEFSKKTCLVARKPKNKETCPYI